MFYLSTEAVDWFFSRDTRTFTDREKAETICKMRLDGYTYREIGKAVGLCKDRVREYCVKVQNTYNRYCKVTR